MDFGPTHLMDNEHRQALATRIALLSEREKDCLRGVLSYGRTKHISAALGITGATIDSHIAKAMRTLGAKNRTQAANMLFIAEHPESPPTPEPVDTRSAFERLIDTSHWTIMQKLIFMGVSIVVLIFAFALLVSMVSILDQVAPSRS